MTAQFTTIFPLGESNEDSRFCVVGSEKVLCAIKCDDWKTFTSTNVNSRILCLGSTPGPAQGITCVTENHELKIYGLRLHSRLIVKEIRPVKSRRISSIGTSDVAGEVTPGTENVSPPSFPNKTFDSKSFLSPPAKKRRWSSQGDLKESKCELQLLGKTTFTVQRKPIRIEQVQTVMINEGHFIIILCNRFAGTFIVFEAHFVSDLKSKWKLRFIKEIDIACLPWRTNEVAAAASIVDWYAFCKKSSPVSENNRTSGQNQILSFTETGTQAATQHRKSNLESSKHYPLKDVQIAMIFYTDVPGFTGGRFTKRFICSSLGQESSCTFPCSPSDPYLAWDIRLLKFRCLNRNSLRRGEIDELISVRPQLRPGTAGFNVPVETNGIRVSKDSTILYLLSPSFVIVCQPRKETAELFSNVLWSTLGPEMGTDKPPVESKQNIEEITHHVAGKFHIIQNSDQILEITIPRGKQTIKMKQDDNLPENFGLRKISTAIKSSSEFKGIFVVTPAFTTCFISTPTTLLSILRFDSKEEKKPIIKTTGVAFLPATIEEGNSIVENFPEDPSEDHFSQKLFWSCNSDKSTTSSEFGRLHFSRSNLPCQKNLQIRIPIQEKSQRIWKISLAFPLVLGIRLSGHPVMYQFLSPTLLQQLHIPSIIRNSGSRITDILFPPDGRLIDHGFLLQCTDGWWKVSIVIEKSRIEIKDAFLISISTPFETLHCCFLLENFVCSVLDSVSGEHGLLVVDPNTQSIVKSNKIANAISRIRVFNRQTTALIFVSFFYVQILEVYSSVTLKYLATISFENLTTSSSLMDFQISSISNQTAILCLSFSSQVAFYSVHFGRNTSASFIRSYNIKSSSPSTEKIISIGGLANWKKNQTAFIIQDKFPSIFIIQGRETKKLKQDSCELKSDDNEMGSVLRFFISSGIPEGNSTIGVPMSPFFCLSTKTGLPNFPSDSFRGENSDVYRKKVNLDSLLNALGIKKEFTIDTHVDLLWLEDTATSDSYQLLSVGSINVNYDLEKNINCIPFENIYLSSPIHSVFDLRSTNSRQSLVISEVKEETLVVNVVNRNSQNLSEMFRLSANSLLSNFTPQSIVFTGIEDEAEKNKTTLIMCIKSLCASLFLFLDISSSVTVESQNDHTFETSYFSIVLPKLEVLSLQLIGRRRLVATTLSSSQWNTKECGAVYINSENIKGQEIQIPYHQISRACNAKKEGETVRFVSPSGWRSSVLFDIATEKFKLT
eukprot:GHVP01026477.1.p1 GENE.GHVP01026477.1~~GHVP01026477.1.p1  ORF type:complete len:1233 (+),score=208.15 GHVP01026477.1:574-4272(+)